MGVAYRCDRCGKYYEWYDEFFGDDRMNGMSPKQRAQWDKDHPDAPFHETSRACFRANALKFMFMNPINDNCKTNGGELSAEIAECDEENNVLIMLCQECMTDFTNCLGNWWSNGGWWYNI